MSNYKYVNGIYAVETPVREPYRRFHGCNAQHARFTLCEDSECLLPHSEVYQFISYATKICSVVHYLKHDTWSISVDYECFDYSPTTTRQFSRWIRETFNGVFDVSDIRDALNKCHSITPCCAQYEVTGSITVNVMTSATLDSVWR